MATKRAVVEQIRYALQRLSARNAFHDFEHVARHWARSEVCRNLVPATGPVSAGGDGGADFETHSVGAGIGAVRMSGEVHGEPTAFCCSLETKVVPKAKSDLKDVAANPRGFKRAFIITSQDLAVGKRNKLIEWARKDLHLTVEVIDANALSEALAQPHLFWIAQEYLSIPSELFPAEESDPEYSEARSNPPREIDTFSKFWIVKRAVRHATQNAPQDVLFWVQLLERERLSSSQPQLATRMLYEEIVARLRGLGTLHGHEDLVRAFLFAFNRDSLAQLKDASVIANYAAGSVGARDSGFTMAEALGFVQAVEATVESLLPRAVDPEERCELLIISLFLVYLRPQGERQGRATALLKEMLRVLERAPLFPRHPIVEWMRFAGEQILDSATRDEVNDALDKFTAAREGQAAAASECTERALRRFEGNDLLGAVRELHRAKIQWLSGEARTETLRACLLISHCYAQLGLFEAAKYYALATLDLSLASEREEPMKISVDAAFELAGQEYARGNWVTSAALVRQACSLAARFRLNPTDLEANTDIGHALHGVAVSTLLSRRFAPSAEPILKKTAADGGFDEFIEGAIAGLDPWKGKSDAEVWKQAGAELDGQPFDDVDRVRSIRWSALGLEFNLKARNERRAVAVAESLAAATQILLASAAHHELKLTRGAVTVDVECVPGSGFRSARQSRSKRLWSVAIGDNWTGLNKKGPTFDEVGSAMDWLQSLSLSPTKEFQRWTGELLREGLTIAVFIGRPYAELWERWIGETGVAESLAGLSRQALPVWTPRERPQLAWRATPLATSAASEGEIRAAIQRRYDRGREALPQTLARLGRSADFQEVARGLRQEGWRDWHILAAVFHVVVNWRLRDQPQPRTREEARAQSRRMFDFRESLDDPEVPMGMLLDVSALKAMRDIFLVSMLPHLDLENRESMPDLRSIEEFLRARAGLDLDVDHQDLFGAKPS